jgi:hypothetical protein
LLEGPDVVKGPDLLEGLEGPDVLKGLGLLDWPDWLDGLFHDASSSLSSLWLGVGLDFPSETVRPPRACSPTAQVGVLTTGRREALPEAEALGGLGSREGSMLDADVEDTGPRAQGRGQRTEDRGQRTEKTG